MKRAQEVTFGGSGLDRGAELRGDAPALGALWAHPQSRVLLMWQGKPLCKRPAPQEAIEGLALLETNHPLVAGQFDAALFLGRQDPSERTDMGGYFALDLTDWQPPEPAPESLGSFSDPSEQHHPELPQEQVFAELRRVMTLLSAREAELATTAKALLAWHASHGFCACCGAGSDLAMAGWMRRCTACGASHFPRTDPVVIMLITRGDRVLMGRSPGWPEGMYSLLAGFVEPGETVEAAVRREVAEECAVQVGEVRYLASQPWAFPMSLMLGCHGTALSEDIRIDPAEIEHAMWMTRQEVMDAFAGTHPQVLPARKGAIAHFLLQHWLADTLG